jgi:hypothetical protein
VSGFAWLVIDPYPHFAPDLTHLGLGALLAGVGGVAAVIGQRVWPAPIELPVPQSSRNSSLMKLKAGEGQKESVRPTRWVRILIGATAVVCGVMAADSVRSGLGYMPKGMFNLGGPGAAPRIDAQIAAFLVLLGGMVAGAATGAGLRHGLTAGLFAAVGLVAMMSMTAGDPLPAVQFVMEKLGLAETPREAVAAVGGITLGITTLGGWLGGQLLPPLSRRRRLARM